MNIVCNVFTKHRQAIGFLVIFSGLFIANVAFANTPIITTTGLAWGVLFAYFPIILLFIVISAFFQKRWTMVPIFSLIFITLLFVTTPDTLSRLSMIGIEAAAKDALIVMFLVFVFSLFISKLKKGRDIQVFVSRLGWQQVSAIYFIYLMILWIPHKVNVEAVAAFFRSFFNIYPTLGPVGETINFRLVIPWLGLPFLILLAQTYVFGKNNNNNRVFKYFLTFLSLVVILLFAVLTVFIIFIIINACFIQDSPIEDFFRSSNLWNLWPRYCEFGM